jgi:protein involved in polysaccharide export with SLBB domain
MSKSGRSLWARFAAIVFLLASVAGAHAQSTAPSEQLPRTMDQSANPNDSLPPLNDQTTSGYGDPQYTSQYPSPYASSARQQQQAEDAQWSLPASHILDLIQQRPEIAVELKQLLTEKLRDAGLTLQDDGISDEALFRRITGDPNFRSSATLLMEARGYVTADDFRDAPGLNSNSTQNSRLGDPLSLQTGSAPDGTVSNFGNMRGDPDSLSPLDRTNPSDLSDLDIDLSQQLDRTQLTPRQGSQYPMQQTQRQDGSQMRSPSMASRPLTDEDRTKSAPGPELLHKPTPYNLLSLRDLYTQVPTQQQTITRFGADVFLRRSPMAQTASSSAQASALDLPIGPDYVLGPGDGLTVTVWGGVSQTLSRVVDSTGKITLPEVGPVALAGMKLGAAQEMLQRILAPQFRSAHVDVTLARLRTVRVYVVGDVQRPGAYDLHSLSSPLNALYAAGGPTSVGSLRTLRHMRGATVVSDIDLYDFLLHGIRIPTQQLEDGDTILVPPAGPQITVTGSVKRPAIYEMKGETKLSEVLDDAGGIQVSAALRHISVERIAANDHRETLRIGAASDGLPELHHALDAFAVMDGDKVVVAPIVPWSNSAIYVEGHVVRPGRVPYQDDMTLTDVIRSYQDLLPEPSEHGEIIRLMPPDLRPETIEFNLTDALGGKTPIPLRPLDTIRITGRYESDAPKVTVRGEVLRPGIYSLSSGMTAGELVKMAGGFTRSALRSDADLASYEIDNGKAVTSLRTTVSIGDAVLRSGGPGDPPLKPGDVLTIHQVTGWKDIGASVRINGEVAYPGTYGLQEGEKLSAVLRRAGGFRSTAYPAGAILLRLQVRDLEEKSRAELIHQIETSSVASRLGTNLTGTDQASTLQLLNQQQDQVLQRLRSQPASGRLVIRINADIGSWENTPADIELRAGDVLIIPKRPGFILVSGQVYNASAITFVPHQTAGWYLGHSGGTTDFANNKEIFIIRANGDVIGRRSGSWYQVKVLSTRLEPGDVIVVPQKIIGGSMFWKNMLTTAQLFSSVAIPLAIAGL